MLTIELLCSCNKEGKVYHPLLKVRGQDWFKKKNKPIFGSSAVERT